MKILLLYIIIILFLNNASVKADLMAKYEKDSRKKLNLNYTWLILFILKIVVIYRFIIYLGLY